MQTQRIILRPWLDTDAPSLYRYASDPDVGPRAGWPAHKSIDESLTVIRTYFANDRTWAITLRETDEAIGCIGYYTHDLSNIPIGKNDCEVGYWLGKPYWGQGICTEALRLIIDYCVNTMHFDNIWADHFTGNPASGRVLEHCGFADTGRLNRCSHLVGGDLDMVRVMIWDRQAQALQLALEVFMQFEAPDYPDHGIASFRNALHDPDYLSQLTYYVHTDYGRVVGMLATRCQGSHIALFFVDSRYHRHGIGRRLFEQALSHCPTQTMTVFSSPYAIPVYTALGFVPTGDTQTDDGISYTPMQISKQ